MRETTTQKAIIDYLKKIGWGTSIDANELKEHGVDIRVRYDRYPRYWWIEVKGDPSTKAKYPDGQRHKYFEVAIGQIITRMHLKAKYRFGIGFPESFKDLVKEHLTYNVCTQLNLYVFLVANKNNVELLDWRDIKAQHDQKNVRRKNNR